MTAPLHTHYVERKVTAREQFRAVTEYPAINPELTHWVDSYSEAMDNGMTMLALSPSTPAFHIDKRYAREYEVESATSEPQCNYGSETRS